MNALLKFAQAFENSLYPVGVVAATFLLAIVGYGLYDLAVIVWRLS